MLDSLFARGGSDASWKSGGAGEGTPCKVIKSMPDQVANFGDSRAIAATVLIKVRKSEIESPCANDLVTIDGEDFQIIGTPLRDKHRICWLCEAVEVQ